MLRLTRIFRAVTMTFKRCYTLSGTLLAMLPMAAIAADPPKWAFTEQDYFDRATRHDLSRMATKCVAHEVQWGRAVLRNEGYNATIRLENQCGFDINVAIATRYRDGSSFTIAFPGRFPKHYHSVKVDESKTLRRDMDSKELKLCACNTDERLWPFHIPAFVLRSNPKEIVGCWCSTSNFDFWFDEGRESFEAYPGESAKHPELRQ
jgi:hypothetical protein